MFIPPAFAMTERDAQLQVIRDCDFGIVVSSGDGGLAGTHLPFLLDDTRGAQGALLGHMARANPQWQDMADGQEALVLFSGPHAYISPLWYTNPDREVPTWNYVAVHVYGRVRIIDDPEAALDIIDRLTAAHENAAPDGWRVSRLDPKQRERMMAAIIAFRIDIERIEGKAKLGQNKPAADRLAAADQLERLGLTDMARRMKSVEGG